MLFIDPDIFILHSVIYCIIFTLSLVPVGVINPRMMLHSYPKEVQKLVPPKTDKERGMTVYFAIPLLVVMIGYPAIVTWYYNPQPTEFLPVFATMWGLMLAMNLYDLLVLDWVMFCAITPKFVVIKGSEGSPGYKDYMFHFIGFLKGIVITVVISAITSGIIYLVG
jgi:hypothetical protein